MTSLLFVCLSDVIYNKIYFLLSGIALISDRSSWALISNKWRYLHILICFLYNYIVSFSGYQTLLKDPVNKSEYSNRKKLLYLFRTDDAASVRKHLKRLHAYAQTPYTQYTKQTWRL